MLYTLNKSAVLYRCLYCNPVPQSCTAVRGLLLDSRKAQTSSYVPAVAEGLLAVPASGGAADQGRHSAGLAAGAGQQAQVAMLCLERLISLGGWRVVGGFVGRNVCGALDGWVMMAE
jgi:hypothetical protein